MLLVPLRDFTKPPLRAALSLELNYLSTTSSRRNVWCHLNHKSDIILKLQNLKAMDSNGFSDPYVELHLLPSNAEATKSTSRAIEKTLNPEWNEELHYYGVTEADKQEKTL
ncbi:hypothetical protein GCK32_006081 [Trichostrongylus colubriformis]|uniref:C2 domain-containing protein n=1 Tax=Trichostrongylus colubriformis TaxID=6319 RepID=A0AAN8F391_TRICO